MDNKAFCEQLCLIEKGKKYLIIKNENADKIDKNDKVTKVYPMGQLLCECSFLDIDEIVIDILSYKGGKEDLNKDNLNNAISYYKNYFLNKYTYIQAKIIMVELFNFVYNHFNNISKSNSDMDRNFDIEDKDNRFKNNLIRNKVGEIDKSTIQGAFIIALIYTRRSLEKLKKIANIIFEKHEEDSDLNELFGIFQGNQFLKQNIKSYYVMIGKNTEDILDSSMEENDELEKNLDAVEIIKGISNIDSLIALEIYNFFYNKVTWNFCACCKRPFVVFKNNKTMYCAYPSLDNPSKLCREVAAEKKTIENRNNDRIKLNYRKKYIRLKKYDDRHETDIGYEKRANLFAEQYKKLKNELKNSTISEQEVLDWIEKF